MKIRNGFISNSSSSSFILYGFPITKLPLGIQRALEGMDYIPDIEVDIGGGSDLFVGTLIKYCTGTHYCHNRYEDIAEEVEIDSSQEDLEAKREFIKKGFKEYYGIDVQDEWFKTYYLEYFS